MTKPEFNVGDRVGWNYGVGKGKGHVLERVTKPTKLSGKNFKATPEEPKYRIKSDNGKELIRNPETLQMLKEDASDGKEQEEMEEAPEVPSEDDDEDVKGTKKE